MVCAACKTNKAELDPYWGYLPCIECQQRQKSLQKPQQQTEFTTDDIKQGRKAYWGDYHPSHRKGKASREFRDTYGKRAMKRQGFSDKEIDNAQYVWSGDDTYYKQGN